MSETLILSTIHSVFHGDIRDRDPGSLIFMGPWCFCGRDEELQDLHSYRFVPEPFADHRHLPQAILQTKALTQKLLPSVAADLGKGTALPMLYWETLLLPWLANLATQIVERTCRIRLAMERFGGRELLIPVCDTERSVISFETEQDFMLRGALGEAFNYFLFSWLLTHTDLPENWTLRVGDPCRVESPPEEKPAAGLKGLPQTFRSCIREALRHLPVPHLKGMSVFQSLLFSLPLLRTLTTEDQSHPLMDTVFPDDILDPLRLPDDLLPLVRLTVPGRIQKLSHPESLQETCHPRLFCAGIDAYEDTHYRQRLACLRGRHHRLFFVQHGGNYGQVRYTCLTELVEYSQHAFLTWGWKTQTGAQGRFIPVPYPQLVRIRDRAARTKRDTILFVGTEMPLYGYRLDAHPTPLQAVAYRNAKKTFLETLPDSLRSRVLYRPYFPVPSTLEDGPFLQKAFPGLRLCTGPLMPHVLATRLLILDHHGTSLLEAMAANVPLLCYWNREHWPLTPESEAMLDLLHSVGIFHETPLECARNATLLWDHVTDWWQSADVQNARQRFCAQFADTGTPVTSTWIKQLARL